EREEELDDEPSDDPSEETDPEDTPDTTPAPPAPDPPRPGERTASCSAVSGSDRSVTTVKYRITDGEIVFRELVVQVTNADGRDKNDVDVFVTEPNVAEVFSFNSG